MITPNPKKILWCYGVYQKFFADLQSEKVTFHEGLPRESSFSDDENMLLILDDLMCEDQNEIAKLFIRSSHHRNISVCYVTQNLFFQSKQQRTISLNCHYLILFKNPRDITQITHLARQMYPKGKSKALVEAFKDATQKAYGYLLLDMKPQTHDDLRLRSEIFPGENQFVYVPK